MPLPQITLVGNLTADPELRFTQAGKAWATLRLACNDRTKNDQGEWVDGETTFIDVVTWRAAEAVNSTLAKGSRVLVTGTLKQRDYQTASGEKRTAYQVNVDFIGQAMVDKTGQTSGFQGVTQDTPGSTFPDDDIPF